MLGELDDSAINFTAEAVQFITGAVRLAEKDWQQPACAIVSWSEIWSFPKDAVIPPPQFDQADAATEERRREQLANVPGVTHEFRVSVALERLDRIPENAPLRYINGAPLLVDARTFDEIMQRDGLVIDFDEVTERLSTSTGNDSIPRAYGGDGYEILASFIPRLRCAQSPEKTDERHRTQPWRRTTGEHAAPSRRTRQTNG